MEILLGTALFGTILDVTLMTCCSQQKQTK